MSRLPVPGQDDGIWGNVLNDFLLTAHTADGSLKPATIASKADDSAVVHLSGTETVNGDKNFVGNLNKNGVPVATANDVNSAVATETSAREAADQVLADAISGRVIVGATQPGTTGSWPTSGNHSFVVKIHVDKPGTFSDLKMYIKERAGANGTQHLRGVVYGSASGPGTLISAGADVAITAGSLERWVSLPGTWTVTTPGDYWLGAFFDVGANSSNQVGAIAYSTPGGEVTHSNNDAYSDGPAASFVSAVAYPWVASVTAIFTGIDVVGISVNAGGTILSNEATTLVFPNATGSVAGNVVTIHTAPLPGNGATIVGDPNSPTGYSQITPISGSPSIEAAFPLAAGDKFIGPWVDGGVSPISIVMASARSDQAGTLSIEESDDRITSTQIIAGSSSTATVLNATPVKRYSRLVYQNGSSLQTFNSIMRKTL